MSKDRQITASWSISTEKPQPVDQVYLKPKDRRERLLFDISPEITKCTKCGEYYDNTNAQSQTHCNPCWIPQNIASKMAEDIAKEVDNDIMRSLLAVADGTNPEKEKKNGNNIR